MALERLTQITDVGIQSGITLRNINVEGAYVSGVVTATSLNITSAGANFTGVVTATSFVGSGANLTGIAVTANVRTNTLNVSGVTTFGSNVFLGDGDIAYFGDGNDLLIFHNSTDSIIRDDGTGDLFIQGGNKIRLTNPTGIETYAVFNQDGASELWYDNAKKIETTGAGVSVTGNLVVSGIITSGTSTVTIDGPNNSITVGQSFIKQTSIGIGTTTTAGRNAGVGTAIGTVIYNSSTQQLEVYHGEGGWIGGLSLPWSASSPTVTANTSSRPGWAVFSFTSPGSLIVVGGPAKTAEYLVVGGGGGGSTGSPAERAGGGGGAGGMRTGSISLSAGTYTVQVGGGGAGGNGAGPTGPTGPGVPSFFGPITSEGGGAGGGAYQNHPEIPAFGYMDGGSGGGAGGTNSPPYLGTGGTGNRISGPQAPVPPQGNNGGPNGSTTGSGGGGGAGGVGGTGPNGGPGSGSPSSITGSPVTYAAGGAGNTPTSSGARTVTAGTTNRGGGGGGSEGLFGFPGAPNPVVGANGGSGIVIIAYPTS